MGSSRKRSNALLAQAFSARDGLEEYDLRWSLPSDDLVKTLGPQILKSNGFASPYSQLKWKFSIKTTQLKTLKVFEPNSQAKTAPDRGIGGGDVVDGRPPERIRLGGRVDFSTENRSTSDEPDRQDWARYRQAMVSGPGR